MAILNRVQKQLSLCTTTTKKQTSNDKKHMHASEANLYMKLQRNYTEPIDARAKVTTQTLVYLDVATTSSHGYPCIGTRNVRHATNRNVK